MAKDPSSFYTPGRRGLSWIKLKKEFATLDVVVVAVEYGHGRRSKVLSDYTFAVRDEVRARTPAHRKGVFGPDRRRDRRPYRKVSQDLATSRQGNRIEVEPTIVIEVAFDSIQKSDRHASGLALRFPRIKRVRWDKTRSRNRYALPPRDALRESRGHPKRSVPKRPPRRHSHDNLESPAFALRWLPLKIIAHLVQGRITLSVGRAGT